MLLINYEHYEHFNQLVINYWEAKEDMVHMCEKWYDYMQPGWC